MQNYVRAQRREYWQNEQQKGLWNECKGSLALIVVSEELQGADQRQRCLAFRNAMCWAALEQRHDAGVSPVDSRKGARPRALKRATSLRPSGWLHRIFPQRAPRPLLGGPVSNLPVFALSFAALENASVSRDDRNLYLSPSFSTESRLRTSV